HRAVLLVEGDEAIGAASLIAPAAVDHAEDNQVAVHDRTGEATTVAAAPAEFFNQGVLPEDLAVLAKAGQKPLRAVGVDVVGLGIAHQVRPAHAADVDVGKKDIEAMLPDGLAGVGIQTQNAFAGIGSLADRTYQINVVPLHQRRRPTAKFLLPDQVLTIGRPGVRQILFP